MSPAPREGPIMPPDHPRLRLSAYLDGELTTREAAAMRSHLEHCFDCRCAMRQVCAGRRLLGALPFVTPRTSLWADILRDPRLALAHLAARRRLNCRGHS